jgi:hypothetical protein
MRKPVRSFLFASLLAAVAVPAAAQRPDQPGKPDKPKDSRDQPAVRVVFQESDRGVFRNYYRAHRDAVKPLPPGIAKNLVRGKPLPPGIARTRVPDAVLVQLPWRPRGYEVLLVGDRVVLLDPNGLVADVLISIF